MAGLAPPSATDDIGKTRRDLSRMRHEEGGELRRPRHGGGQADGRELGRVGAQPRKIERQEIAALARRQRMQLIENDEAQRGEQAGAVLMRQHQRDLLGRGEQDVGRGLALARAAGGRRVAGAGLEP